MDARRLLDLYCIVLMIVLIVSMRKGNQHRSAQGYRLYNLMYFVLCCIVLDLGTTWLPTFPGGPQIVRVCRFLQYATDMFALWFYMRYVQIYLVNEAKRHVERWVDGILMLCSVNAVLVIVSTLLHLDWFYSLDNNVYVRGPFYNTRAFVTLVVSLFVCVYALRNRRSIPLVSLIWLPFVVMTAGVVQAVLPQIQVLYSSMVVMLIIVYITAQDTILHEDFLTHTVTRRMVDNSLKAWVERAENHPFSMMVFDLDDFKQINDTYGHEKGDEALQVFSKQLNSCFRREDIIGRYGGDEFVVLARMTREAQIIARLKRLDELLQDRKRDFPFEIRYSVGYVICDGKETDTPDSLFKKADSLMYENKQKKHAQDSV